jgi:hypothetical protein
LPTSELAPICRTRRTDHLLLNTHPPERQSTTYHFRVVAENEAGTSYGEDMTLTTQKSSNLIIEPPGGSFPASFTLAGEQKVSLRTDLFSVNCTTESKVQSIGGEGQFESASSGTATLTLRNCKENLVNTKCTSAEQAVGTIKIEALPFNLVFLSDGKPGLLSLLVSDHAKLSLGDHRPTFLDDH